MKRILVITLAFPALLLSVLGLWSCSPKSYSGPVESITIGTFLVEPSIPIFVAEDRQFFAQNGLNVTIRYYDTGAKTVSGLLNDETDVSLAGEYVLAGEALNKETVETIGCIDEVDYAIVIGRKDRGITAISQLTGKRIGVIRGTAVEFYLGRFMTLHGLDIRDATLVDMDSNSGSVDAIVNGDVDAIIAVSPYGEDALRKLGGNAVSWKAQAGQMIHMLLIGRNQWIAEHPVVVERLLKVMNQAEDYIFQYPEEAKAIAKKKLNLTDEEISEIWARNQFSLSLPESLVVAMEDEARWMIANNLTTEKQVPDFTDYIYEDALKAVEPEAVRIIR